MPRRKVDLDHELAEAIARPSPSTGDVPVVTPEAWRSRCSGDPRCGRCRMCATEARASIAADVAARSDKHAGYRAPRATRWGSPEAAFRALVLARESVGARSTIGASLESLRQNVPLGGSGVPSSGGPQERIALHVVEVDRAVRLAVETYTGPVRPDQVALVVEALLVGVVPAPAKPKNGRPRSRGEHGRISVTTGAVAEAVGVSMPAVRDALGHVMRTLTVELAAVGLLPRPAIGTRARLDVEHRIATRRAP